MRRREAMLLLGFALMARGALVAAQEFVNITYIPPILTVRGAELGDGIGAFEQAAAAVGDISGDGVPDLVFGSWGPDGPANVRIDTGEVYVLFGPIAGPRIQDLATEPADLILYGREASGFLGSSWLVADLNGDGQDDLVVGQDSSRRPDTNDSVRGEVCVFFGPLAAGVIDLALDEPDLAITGSRAGDRFGASVAAGDVSGDGVLDLVVGAHGATVGTRIRVGSVSVLHGPLQPGPIRHLSVTPPDVLILGTDPGARFGDTIALGDLSGDGVEDIAVAARFAPSVGGAPNAGKVAVAFGGQAAGTTVDLLATPPGVLVTGADAEDWLGQSVAIGDMTHDGAPDLFIGALQADGPGNAALECGEFQILLGPLAAGTSIDNVTSLPDITLISRAGARMGAAADVAEYPDGSQRVLLSAFENDNIECGSFGVVSVLDALPPVGSVVDLSVQPAPLSIGSRSAAFGTTCVLADVTGDGIPEPIISSRYDGVFNDRSGAGAVHVVAYGDRCEEDPPGLGPSGLHLRRSGNDVLLDFDETGLGDDSVGVDLFRGTLREFKVERRHDHALMNPCGLLSSPGIDPGAAAPGVQHYYYLGTRGCPDACSPYRKMGGLGDSSTGPRPVPFWPPDTTCR